MLADLTLKEFLEKTSSDSPIPGGGSISALNGAIAASLTEMMARLTLGREKYIDEESNMNIIIFEAQNIRNQMLEYVDKDSKAYEEVFKAYKLPKTTEAEKELRTNAIEIATKRAALIPLEVAEIMATVIDGISYAAMHGNRNAVTDATIAMMMARTCIIGALLNVKTNLSSIKDKDFVTNTSKHIKEIEEEVLRKEIELLNWTNTIL